MSASGRTADKFPAGLRVLVVDDDRTCLMLLETTLRKCNYQVTKCDRGEAALSILRENKDGFDVVISDVHMPDMDGFKLLVQIGLEMNLPVIMMSVDDSKSVVMKGVIHGACDYLIKPVRIEQLRNIWQHVVRKRTKEGKDIEPSANLDDSDRMQKQQHDDPESSSANQGHNFKNIKRRKDEEDETEEKDDSSYVKKPRVTWTEELHQQFLAAVIHLGIDKAVPKKILELMNVPGITRENVASHLQKFRIYLKKLKDEQSGGMNNQDAGYRPFSEPDLHSLAAIGQVNQLPAQSLATLQTAAFNRSGNSVYPVLPPVDQTNTSFTFDTAKPRYGNQQGNYCNISKQMSFLHGIPTTTNSLTNIHNPQAPNPMSGQSLSQTHNHALQKPVLPILAASQAAPHKTMSTRNGFSHLGIPPIMSTSTFQQDRNVKATNSTQGFVSSYGHLKTVNQNRTHDSTFDPSQHRNYTQGRLNVPHHNYALGKKMMGSQVTFSPGESSGSNIADIPSNTIVEHQQSYPLENSQGDLLTAILTQQKLQEDVGDAENEYAHNSDSLDKNEG